jgi:cell wall hydrolase
VSPREGKIAVAYVILNRIKSGGWGDSIKDVVTSPWQFEPWMTKRDAMEKLSTTSPFRFLNSSWSTTKWFYQVPRKRL